MAPVDWFHMPIINRGRGFVLRLPSRSDNLPNPTVDGFGDLAAGMTEELAGVSKVSFACSLGADVSKLKFLYSGD